MVGTADTEADAIVAIKREAVDVTIRDLHLRQGTGFGVMRALATAQRKPRIIVMTNNDLLEYKKAALALGATDVLDKARDYGRLPTRLHEICDASQAFKALNANAFILNTKGTADHGHCDHCDYFLAVVWRWRRTLLGHGLWMGNRPHWIDHSRASHRVAVEWLSRPAGSAPLAAEA